MPDRCPLNLDKPCPTVRTVGDLTARQTPRPRRSRLLGSVGMTAHPCPMTVGELMALHAIAKAAGFDVHAARLLAHADQHTPPQQPREDES